MSFRFKKLGNLIPVIKDTFMRFPLAFISTISGTLIALFLVQDIEGVDTKFYARCLASLAYATAAFTALTLFIESRSWPMSRHIVAATIIALIIIFYVWGVIVESTAPTYMLFSLLILLSLLFSPYIKSQSNSASVWYFNYQTGVAVFFAAIAATILGAGLSLILASMGYLFEIDISNKLYRDAWVIAWGVLFTLYILSNIAKTFDYEDESCDFPKGVRFITNYLLVPLMFVYMFILYAYFIKIIVQWELPRGNLGWMITTFGSIGIITKLLAYPIRNSGTRMLVVFDQYYYYALIVPIVLLVISISVRINDYGMTEPRYAVALLGLWFLSVIVLTFIKKDNFQIKYVPMILAVLALFSSIGPWGMVSVSLNSQAERFESLLSKHNLLHEGQAIKSSIEIPFEDRRSLSSMAKYFSREDYRKKRIAPLFKTLLSERTDKSTTSLKGMTARKYIELLGFDYVNRHQNSNNIQYFKYSLNSRTNHVMVGITGFDYVGRHRIYTSVKKLVKHKFSLMENNELREISVSFDGKVLSVENDSGETVLFNLYEHISNLRKTYESEIKTRDMDKLTLTRQSDGGRFKARLLLEEVRGQVLGDKSIKINNIEFILMTMKK